MVRVHRQMSADGVPFSPDQAVSPLTTQLQVSTTQVKFATSREEGPSSRYFTGHQKFQTVIVENFI
jgi:hypothetical protein